MVADESQRALWRAVGVSFTAAAIGVVVLSITGHPRFGLALSGGLVLGALTGPLALRSLYSGFSFRMASIGRIGIQSVLGLGLGYLLGTDVIWVPIVGLAAAQVVLAAVAVQGVLATR